MACARQCFVDKQNLEADQVLLSLFKMKGRGLDMGSCLVDWSMGQRLLLCLYRVGQERGRR